MKQELKELRAMVQQLGAALQQQKQQLDSLTKAVRMGETATKKLGAVSGLMWVEELQDWVSEGKWKELKANPR